MQTPQVQVSFSQKGMTVAVGERKVLIGQRERLAASITVALLVHMLVLWSLVTSRYNEMDIHVVYDDNVVDAELYRPEPIPDIPPPPLPRPVHQLHQEPMTSWQPPVPQPAPSPSPQPAPQQAQAEPTPAPDTQLKVAPRQVDNIQAINSPVAKAIPQPQPALQNAPSSIPTVEDTPSPTPMKAKKKEEEETLDAKRQIANAPTPPSDLNLHEASVPNVQLSPVAPSGLTPNPASRLASGGGAPAGGAAGAAGGGGSGVVGLKGRGTATQALQNHENCITRQTAGKPIPVPCNMKDLASMTPTGPKADADFQAAAAKRDANLKYKTDPGNADYWKRVGHAPDQYHNTEDFAKPGQYSSAKDQRVMAGNVASGNVR
jgi:hypothetical protein